MSRVFPRTHGLRRTDKRSSTARSGTMTPIQVYSVRVEFPQSTKVDLPSAALLALSSNGDLELAMDPVFQGNFLGGTMAQAQMAGGSPRALQKGVIAADYSPDGKELALTRHTNGKVQLEFPAGNVIYKTSGY